MSFFSRLAVSLIEEEDLSYPSPQRQLRWRLDELNERRNELISMGAGYGRIKPNDLTELRYISPLSISCVSMVDRAIELAILDMSKYNDDLYALPDPFIQEYKQVMSNNEEMVNSRVA